jgi:hypothetical protein
LTDEEPIFDAKGNRMGWVKKDGMLLWDEKNPGAINQTSKTPYIDSLNSLDKPKKRVGRDKGLTELLGGSFSR